MTVGEQRVVRPFNRAMTGPFLGRPPAASPLLRSWRSLALRRALPVVLLLALAIDVKRPRLTPEVRLPLPLGAEKGGATRSETSRVASSAPPFLPPLGVPSMSRVPLRFPGRPPPPAGGGRGPDEPE